MQWDADLGELTEFHDIFQRVGMVWDVLEG